MFGRTGSVWREPILRRTLRRLDGRRESLHASGQTRLMDRRPRLFRSRERSPQDERGPVSEVFSLDRREPMGEDCLKVNIYTPGLAMAAGL